MFSLVLMVGTNSHAQTRKDKKEQRNENLSQPNAFSPYGQNRSSAQSVEQRNKKSVAKKKHKKGGLALTFDQKIEEYEQRMVANAKRYKKMEKEMEKPQYSDPAYFGHKRKPKKRPIGKRKYCKECGIVH